MEVDRTLYISNLPPEATEALIYELFLQSGPIESVSMKNGFCFVTFEDEESVLYACSIFEGVRLFECQLKVKPRQGSKHLNTMIPSIPPYPSTLSRSSSFSEHPNDTPYYPTRYTTHNLDSQHSGSMNSIHAGFSNAQTFSPLAYTHQNLYPQPSSYPNSTSQPSSHCRNNSYSRSGSQSNYTTPPPTGTHRSYPMQPNFYWIYE